MHEKDVAAIDKDAALNLKDEATIKEAVAVSKKAEFFKNAETGVVLDGLRIQTDGVAEESTDSAKPEKACAKLQAQVAPADGGAAAENRGVAAFKTCAATSSAVLFRDKRGGTG